MKNVGKQNHKRTWFAGILHVWSSHQPLFNSDCAIEWLQNNDNICVWTGTRSPGEKKVLICDPLNLSAWNHFHLISCPSFWINEGIQWCFVKEEPAALCKVPWNDQVSYKHPFQGVSLDTEHYPVPPKLVLFLNTVAGHLTNIASNNSHF